MSVKEMQAQLEQEFLAAAGAEEQPEEAQEAPAGNEPAPEETPKDEEPLAEKKEAEGQPEVDAEPAESDEEALERSWKAVTERYKAVTERAKEARQYEAAARELQSLQQKLKADPLSVLKEQGIDPLDLVGSMLGEEPQAKQQASPEVADLRATVEKLQSDIAARDEQAVAAQAHENVRQQIASSEKHQVLRRAIERRPALVSSIIQQFGVAYSENGPQTDIREIFDQYEAQVREGLLESVQIAEALGLVKTAEKAPAKAPGPKETKTLTNNMTGDSPATGKRAKSKTDRENEFLRALADGDEG